MKLKNIYSLIAGSLVLLAACSPDDNNMGGAQYTSDELTYPNGFSIETFKPNTDTIVGNRITLASKLTGCTPLWITPTGSRSQADSIKNLSLPFAGKYQVTFGAETSAGPVYGSPKDLIIAQNDFTLLDDEKWFYLADSLYKKGEAFPDAATLMDGVHKTWFPCDSDYGLGCTAPMMYISPYDPTGSGNYTEAEKAALVYKDIPFGRDNWTYNWDPGFQSWLLPNTKKDCYLKSYMKFSMDAKNGCVLEEYRGETGDTTTYSGTKTTGKFMLDVETDKNHPTLSFTNCYAMHNVGFDDVCNNYTQNIIIADLTPYYLCLVTKRTNSEGNWYIVWNFVSREVKDTKGACIPKAEASYITVSSPVLPTYTDLPTSLFTVENNGSTYVGNNITYTVDTDAPYDIQWWNGAENINKWQSILADKDGNVTYNSTWAPMADEGYSDNELTLSKQSDGTYTYSYGNYEGKLKIGKNTLTFDKGISFLTATSKTRTIEVTGTTFTILKQSEAEGMLIGIPQSKDAKGNVNSYTCVKLNVKPIGGGTTGPTVVPLDLSDVASHTWIENKCFRLAFYHYGDGGTGIFKDAGSVKLKKGQKITVKFTLKDASAWTDAPKCALIDNNIKTTWEPDCFSLDDAVTVNLAGETTVTLTNTTSSTQKFTPTCLDLSIQMDGFYKDWNGEVPEAGVIDKISCEIE